MACACTSSLSLSLAIFSILLIQLPTGSWAKSHHVNAVLEYHNGPLLTGEINLAVLWYGRFGKVQKTVLRDFIRSLNKPGSQDPSVNTWWKMVEKYQGLIPGGNAHSPIRVKIVEQRTDRSYSVGKVLTQDFFSSLVDKAFAGVSNPTVAVIFASKEVSIAGTCMGKCSTHGVVGTGNTGKLYIVVGNPESECPSACAWPFHNSPKGPTMTVPIRPPNGNIGVDAMVIEFATALAHIVTNPYQTGFYYGSQIDMTEAIDACYQIFGSGSFPGFPGKVRVSPRTGGTFNAHGVKQRKFLLPAVWNARTHTCQTLL